MSMNDTLAAAMSKIEMAEKLGNATCKIYPSSKIIKNILTLMKDKGYIGEYKESSESKGGLLSINLLGKLNKCGAIKPRFAVKKEEFEKFEKRFLPAKGFGFLVVSTPSGFLTHEEAKKKNFGGKLIAYFY
ncbi:30S ribosomal protein S8 [Nanoarchaeota archaeon]